MAGNVSQLSNQCVDSPLGNYNTQICLSSWFESNLSNRSQYVVYNNNSSNFVSITNGVPQGSILGTQLLLLLFVTSSQAQISAFDCTSMLHEGPSPRGFSATKQNLIHRCALYTEIYGMQGNLLSSRLHCQTLQGIIFPVSHRNSRCIFSHLRRIFFHESQLLRCKRNVHSYTQTANPQTTYTLDAPISDPYIPGRLG